VTALFIVVGCTLAALTAVVIAVLVPPQPDEDIRAALERDKKWEARRKAWKDKLK
jgi:hypothetical protein